MRFDELFKNLGYLAGTIGAQVREACEGVSVEELDLTGPAPRKVALCGPGQVVLREGDVFRVEVEPGPGAADVRFALGEERLNVSGGDRETVITITLPAPRKLTIAGSGRMAAAKLARDGKVSIAGSGRLEVAAVEGGKVNVSLAGSGRAALDGRDWWSTGQRCTSPDRAMRSSRATARSPRI